MGNGRESPLESRGLGTTSTDRAGRAGPRTALRRPLGKHPLERREAETPGAVVEEEEPTSVGARGPGRTDAGAGSAEIDAIAETDADEDWTALEPGAAASG
ncbi:hypothetical protein THAOC_07396, partial [Thalassiosira oceanica]